MTESLQTTTQTSATVAFDPKDGRIVRVHLRHTPVDAHEAAKTEAWLLSVSPANSRVLHLAPGSMEPGQSYRVDVAKGTLVVAKPEEGGVSASSGVIKVG